ncbi:hypothetical protein C8Q78DRAFT_1036700, partial [Trametes maxima]
MEKHAWDCPHNNKTEVEAVASRAAAAVHSAGMPSMSSTSAGIIFTPAISPGPATASSRAPTISASVSTTDSSADYPPLKRVKTAPTGSLSVFDPDATTPLPPLWDSACQQRFAKDLCNLFISCGIAWNVADNPEFCLFFGKWLPYAVIPDRRSLSGTYLNLAAAAVDERVAQRVSGHYAMGQCDGWKNVAKKHVVSTV